MPTRHVFSFALCVLEMGDRLGLRDKNVFKCLWIIDFPLFEWSDEEQRLMATHHPFTMPNPDDIPLLDEHPEQVRAKAYDFVCNGIEVGGGSLRIHDTQLQEKMFEVLGFTPERAEAQFGFLMNAFKYGAPPHAGLAFGLGPFRQHYGWSRQYSRLYCLPKEQLRSRCYA